jgi:hypothetical protein
LYVKIGKLDAALAVAEKLVALHPSPQSEYVRSEISRVMES